MQGVGWGGAAHAGAKVPVSRHRDVTLHPRCVAPRAAHVSTPRSCKLDLGHRRFPGSRQDHEDMAEDFCTEDCRHERGGAVDNSGGWQPAGAQPRARPEGVFAEACSREVGAADSVPFEPPLLSSPKSLLIQQGDLGGGVQSPVPQHPAAQEAGGDAERGAGLPAPVRVVRDEELQVSPLLTAQDISSPALRPPPTPSFYFASFSTSPAPC